MRKILLFACALSFANSAFAQDYTPLQIASGYNADVIANGVGPALLSTTNSFDLTEFVLLSTDYHLFDSDPTNPSALPISGLIDNMATAGLSYQLAPYSGDNALRLQEQFDSGVMVINNAAPATTLYVLAASGNGSGLLGGTIHFSDNTTQEISAGTIPDWFFSDALPVVASDFGRVGRTSDVVELPFGDPRLYQFQIDIDAANQTKTITSIDFNKQSFEEGVINIFAVSAKLLGTCPAPTNLVASSVTNNSFVASWITPVIVPASGYEYYLGVNGVTPTSTSIPTGSVAPNVNTIVLSGLNVGLTYCLWVRSNCGGSEVGPWSEPVCITTGQTSGTYNDGDIPTTYVDFVDTTSTSACPGLLTVAVPDGYVISSIATAYNMQTALNGWMSEQRSLLVCSTNGNTEAEVTSGIGSSTGTYSYNRTGINIANGLTGNVEFQLRAWRTYGQGECDVVYNRVVNGTWSVTITYAALATQTFNTDSFKVYPNPANDVVNISAKENMSEVRIFNLLGQQVSQQNALNSKEVQISTSNLPSGKYLLKITSENGITTKSILKN